MADPAPPLEPPADCGRCPRLVAYRADNRARYPDWHNAPVAAFGGQDAALLIVGLAPGLKGANRTARPFTGDVAGQLLYPTLIKFGFAEGSFEERADDGLELINCRVTNAVRCVPPQNKPDAAEIKSCRDFLGREIAACRRLEVILALGKVAHDAVVRVFGLKLSATPFAHGARHELPHDLPHDLPENIGSLGLWDSYHCSRYNTNTRRLTPEMFEDIFRRLRRALDGGNVSRS